jgi:hypothetical protein
MLAWLQQTLASTPVANIAAISAVISGISAVISLTSLGIAAFVGWFNVFRPARLVGSFPHIGMWMLSSYKGSTPTGEIVGRYLTPAFWLANVGAKEAVVSDLRLKLRPEKSEDEFFAYPAHNVPLEAVESPSLFGNKELLRLGGPFTGFCLVRAEVWKSSHSYAISAERWRSLSGSVAAEVQVREGRSTRWKTILKEAFVFGIYPAQLETLASSGFAAGSQVNTVISESMKKARSEKK